jgi:hypothetical protein
MNRHTDGQTEEHKHRETETETDGQQSNIQTDRQAVSNWAVRQID